ncbi:glycosyltransferase [Bradyrhizobium guangxiense]|uniref:glycosyltransferase n=1 Tax=Bradyrhizobium guangxiense TaxID=1325115 RepID=UPI001008C28C|nr:glycosyltransferase [Bradyrhizobium guangxiense]
MPYNILHVIPYMHPSAGGPPVVVENFVKEANELGHRSRILSTPGYCRGDERELLKRLEQLAPTSFLSPRETLPGIGRARSGTIEAQVREADIVHVHTLWSPLNVSARQACARLGRPYVLMPHGMLDPYSLSVKALKKSIYLHIFEKHNIARAARIIYTTPEEERLAKLAGLPLPAGELVPLGANASTASKSQLQARFVAQFPQVAGKRILLFLGRLHPKKGLDRILGCLHSLRQTVPNLLLVVAGDGDAGYVDELRQRVRELSLDDNVLFAGRLDGDLKWASYAAAELFLLPSRQENFAITVAEAMQMGVPVIVTDKVNTWPYVEEAGAGLVVDEREVDAMLPRAVAEILGDDAARARMAAQGAAYARERLTWPRAIRELLACYDRVISESR